MDAFHLTLFVHIFAVLAASAAASLAIFSGGRYAQSSTHGEARAWLAFNGKVSLVFPVVLIVLLLTGSVMATISGGAYWHTGWVKTGIAVVVLIFASGAFHGKRHKALERALEAMTDAQRHAHQFRAPEDPVLAVLPWVNTCLALGMVFVMTNKPTLGGAVSAVGLAAVVGVSIGLRTIAKAKAATMGAVPASD